MKNAHRTWDEATLGAYLADPRQDIPWIKTIFAALFGEDQLNQILVAQALSTIPASGRRSSPTSRR